MISSGLQKKNIQGGTRLRSTNDMTKNIMEKVKCKHCDALILPTTAKDNDGLCCPCLRNHISSKDIACSPLAPSTEIEKQKVLFFQEIKKLTPDDWLNICLRYDTTEDNIASSQGEISSIISDNIDKLFIDKENRKHKRSFSKELDNHLVLHLLKQPKSTKHNNQLYPLQSASYETARSALRSFIILDQRIKNKNKERILISCLLPFYGYISLPSLPFEKELHQLNTKKGSQEEEKAILYNKKPPEQCSVFHIRFPKDYFTYRTPPPQHLKIPPRNWNRKSTSHDTWNLDSFSDLACRFGGEHEGSCNICNSRLSHLITIPTIHGLQVTGLNKLVISTCTSCLGWDEHVLYFKHKQDGELRPLALGESSNESAFDKEIINPAQVYLCATPPKYFMQDWCECDGQNLNRIGGVPSWIQDEEQIDCPHCQKSMGFLMQLDSGFPPIEGEEILWGSGGVIYIFWCDACKIDGQVWQCS